MNARPGVNVVGYVTGNTGIGVVVREIIGALLARGHPVSAFDVDVGLGRSRLDLRYESVCVPALEALPHRITLWIAGAHALEGPVAAICTKPALQRMFNALYVWWELPHVSPVHAFAAEAFDALVTGSEFVQHAFRNSTGRVPVLLAETPVSIPEGVAGDRSRFGLTEGRFTVLTGFEPASDPVRKNPWGSIEAFRRAFSGSDKAQLVVKLNNANSEGRPSAAVADLERLAADDARIRLVKDRLEHSDLLSLYASCDVTLSLHRAEGLGLMPLEAMRLGKPTVATGWSGNMTYMNHSNSVPVRYKLVPTDQQSVTYSPDAAGIASFWAEPDVAHAAQGLRYLADNSSAYRGMADAARRDSAAYHERALAMRFIDEIAALDVQHGLGPARNWTGVDHRLRELQKERQWQSLGLSEQMKARIGWRVQNLGAKLGFGRVR